MTDIQPIEAYKEDVDLATRAAAAYYDTETELLPDAEYDQLVDRIQTFESAHPEARTQHTLFTDVAAGTSAGGDVKHSRPMLSLDKANTHTEVEAFITKMETAGATIVAEPKLDGLAINLVYVDGDLVQAATRGDGTTGEDVTDRLRALTVNELPDRLTVTGHAVAGRVEVRGELLMSSTDFQVSNAARVAAGKPAFANPRNATAGTIRRQTVGYVSQLSFIAYDAVTDSAPESIRTHTGTMAWLHTLGFKPANDLMPASLERGTILEEVDQFGDARKAPGYHYPTDGIVLTVDEYEIRAALGFTSRAPRSAIAFKYPADVATSTLRDIEMGVGRTGNISFTGVFDPVLVDGSTIGRATLHNMAFIRDRDIRIGDQVVVKKANDVIPRIESSLPEFRPDDAVIYDPEPVCPVSGEPLDTSGAIWRSPAPEASIGALVSYASSRDALDIEGVSDAVATALVSGEQPLVNDLADLFTITEAQLAALSLNDTKTGTSRTLGAKNAAKIAAEIEQAKQQPLNRVITALGIRKSGRTFGRRLAAHFHTMDSLLDARESDFLASGVEGVGPERARLFHEGFQRLRPTIDKLRSAGVNLGTEPEQDDTDASTKPLAGMKVVVTGAMTGPLAGIGRNEMNELVEAGGGTASGSVSKATSLLVCGEPGSSKWTKANDLGIEIVTPEEFAARIGRS